MHPGNPHPDKIRVAVVRAVEQKGMTYAETADMLGIGVASVNRILRRHRETGSVAPKPKAGGRTSPIVNEVADELEELVRATPDATIQEMLDALVASTGVATSLSAMKRALHRLGFSRKKRSSSRPSATKRTT
jgi:transposase